MTTSPQSQPTTHELFWRLKALEKRMEELEEIHPAVLAERVGNLAREVRSLKVAFYSVGAAVIASGIGIIATMIAASHGGT